MINKTSIIETFNIYDQIVVLNSIKDKEALLTSNKDNEILKQTLQYALNPYKLYYINKLSKFKPNSIEDLTENWKKFSNLLDNLEKRKITGKAAKKSIELIFNKFNDSELKLYTKILLKKSLGVGIKTVNKVWPDLVPDFSIMLAPNKQADLFKLKYPSFIQPKLDGFRCIYLPINNKENSLWSRSGRPFPNKNLKNYFNSLLKVGEYVLDGEIYSHKESFQSLCSILNSEDKQLPKDLKYIVYDCVPINDWNKKECSIEYIDRLVKIREIINEQICDYKKVIDISNDEVENIYELKEKYKEHLTNNFEGAIIKDPNGLYKWKRVTVNSGEMLKFKPFKSLDLEVMDVYEGEDSFKNILGGIIVKLPNGNTCRVGSGFNFADRETVFKNTNKYIGKIAELKYFEETEDGSLRHPIFLRWREDK